MTDGARQAAIGAVIALVAFGATAAVFKFNTKPPPEPVVVDLAPPIHAGVSVTMRVLGPDGAPPSECMATMWEEVEGGRRMGMDSSQTCSPTGELTWPTVVPGTYRLMAAGPGLARLDEVVVVADEAVVLGERTLGLGGGVRGVITDSAGATVESVSVRVGARQENGALDGTYLVKGLPLGRQTLFFGSLKGWAELDVVVEAGETVTLDVELKPLRGAVGLRFNEDLTVSEIHPSGPAAGHVTEGQKLTAVGGVEVTTLDEAQEAMRGPAGSVVELTLDGQPMALTRVTMEELLK
jgi:hypothetical protein